MSRLEKRSPMVRSLLSDSKTLGYNAVSLTPMGFTANIYNGKKHQESYICFKRDLTYLDHLKESENGMSFYLSLTL